MSISTNNLLERFSRSIVVGKVLRVWDSYEANGKDTVGKFLSMFGISSSNDIYKFDNILSAMSKINADSCRYEENGIEYDVDSDEIVLLNSVKALSTIYFDDTINKEVKKLNSLETIVEYISNGDKMEELTNPYVLDEDWLCMVGLDDSVDNEVDVVADTMYGFNNLVAYGYDKESYITAENVISDFECNDLISNIWVLESYDQIASLGDNAMTHKIESAAIIEKAQKSFIAIGIMSNFGGPDAKYKVRINGQILDLKIKDIEHEIEKALGKTKGYKVSERNLMNTMIKDFEDDSINIHKYYGSVSVNLNCGTKLHLILI